MDTTVKYHNNTAAVAKNIFEYPFGYKYMKK